MDIPNIDIEDIKNAAKLGYKIKLISESKITDNKSKVENKVKGFINPKISLNTDKYPTLQFVSGLLKLNSR